MELNPSSPLNPRPAPPVEELRQQIQGEYREMPGLQLTFAQAQRLFGLDEVTLHAVFGALVDAQFLMRTRDGAFTRGRGPEGEASSGERGRECAQLNRHASVAACRIHGCIQIKDSKVPSRRIAMGPPDETRLSRRGGLCAGTGLAGTYSWTRFATFGWRTRI